MVRGGCGVGGGGVVVVVVFQGWWWWGLRMGALTKGLAGPPRLGTAGHGERGRKGELEATESL